MDLFTPIVPIEKQHANFVRTCIPDRLGEREVVQGWAEGFPDRDNKFVQEFQTSFNSSFWEVYLHALFREYGFAMDWSHASPDFHLTTPRGGLIVEAVTVHLPRWAFVILENRGRPGTQATLTSPIQALAWLIWHWAWIVVRGASHSTSTTCLTSNR